MRLPSPKHKTNMILIVIWLVVKIYGPFLGTLNIRCRITKGIQKETINLTTTHIQTQIYRPNDSLCHGDFFLMKSSTLRAGRRHPQQDSNSSSFSLRSSLLSPEASPLLHSLFREAVALGRLRPTNLGLGFGFRAGRLAA